MACPGVYEAAVVGILDPRWGERPHACVVAVEGVSLDLAELRNALMGRVPKWWIPTHWSLLESIPKTSVGKFDKKLIRQKSLGGEIAIIEDLGA